MKELELISIHDLKNAVKALNETGFVEKKLKIVGLSKADMIKNFAYAVEHLTDEQAKSLGDKKETKIVKEFYEDIFADELGEAEEKEEVKKETEKELKKEKGKKEPKKEKGKKEPKKEKVLTNLSKFGAHEGSQGFIIDEMLIEGGHTKEEIARAASTKIKRVDAHIQNRKKKGVSIVRDEHGRYTIKE